MFSDTKLNQYATNLVSKKDQEGKIFKLVLDNRFIKELITHLNTDDQLGKDRVDSLGAHLGTYSIFDKKGRGGEHYSLNDTGAFWDSWRVNITDALIDINANPFKKDTNLFNEYGINIVGLTPENLEVLQNEAKELYIQWLRKNV